MSGALQVLLAGGDRIVLNSATYTKVTPGGATSGFRIQNDGFVYAQDQGSAGLFTQRYQWCFPAAAAPNYDVRWSDTTNNVDTSPGAANTNLNLATTRTWQETNSATFESCVISVRIHRAGDTATPIVTAAITLEADGSP